MRISVLGAGAFGSAFASRLAMNKRLDVTLFARDEKVVDEVNKKNSNKKYLSNLVLSKKLRASIDLREMAESDLVFLSIPSSQMQPFFSDVERLALVASCAHVCNLSKGFIGNDGHVLITDFLQCILPEGVILSSAKGPTFSNELLTSPHSAFSIASSDGRGVKDLGRVLKKAKLVFDVNHSLAEIELLSVLKNIYAIAIAVVDGRFKNPNLTSLVFSNALLEMQRLSMLLLGREINVGCYAGVGDLLLTSMNDQSRNRTLGLMLGKRFLSPSNQLSGVVLEGVRSINYIDLLLQSKTDKSELAIKRMAKDFKILFSLSAFLKSELDLDRFIRKIV
ncbi:NAD(P)H-dependent glycerol-3-phosphate dehydrogenase [Thiomicrospira microaerophila]|uniref:NAD(P)H-dependent glycerol-3-phosphate dehydrogenase n=1 Tax=Thiomicrospira microaerophila TaxID=406020 RepID=UPI0005CA6D81|nr:NAD(P)H-dependent glycerol-3-phosphate dehydrogenase [Thiomicrospira microaerophila]